MGQAEDKAVEAKASEDRARLRNADAQRQVADAASQPGRRIEAMNMVAKHKASEGQARMDQD